MGTNERTTETNNNQRKHSQRNLFQNQAKEQLEEAFTPTIKKMLDEKQIEDSDG